MTQHFDAIVVGAGQSGPSLAVRLAEAGRKVGLIERRGLGGTCVNDGCIPTKTLIASARAAWMARRAAEYGITIEGAIRVDWTKVKARKDEMVHASRVGLAKWIGGTANLELIEGHARFAPRGATHRMQVGDRILQADQIFLNVGARALVPDVPGLKDGPYVTNSSMMDLATVLEHLLILGGSYIGLEFAQMMRRFGSKVTVIEREERLIGREDEDVSVENRHFLELEGITFAMGAKRASVEREQDRVILGAAILGVEGDEAIHAIADVMYAKAPYTTISHAVHAHPTVSELVPTTLQSLEPLA